MPHVSHIQDFITDGNYWSSLKHRWPYTAELVRICFYELFMLWLFLLNMNRCSFRQFMYCYTFLKIKKESAWLVVEVFMSTIIWCITSRNIFHNVDRHSTWRLVGFYRTMYQLLPPHFFFCSYNCDSFITLVSSFYWVVLKFGVIVSLCMLWKWYVSIWLHNSQKNRKLHPTPLM